MIIAKQQVNEVVNNEYYELFQPAKAIGIDWEEVDIMQSIWHYSIPQLEQEKQNYLDYITEIDNKIASIKALQE